MSMSIGVCLIIFGTIYGLGIFALVDAIRKAVPVDDNGYPIKNVIPFRPREKKKEAA